MPKFFFDLFENEARFIDNEGTELPDVDAAREEATQTVADIARDQIPRDGPQHYIAMVVRDEAGNAVVRINLAFHLKKLV